MMAATESKSESFTIDESASLQKDDSKPKSVSKRTRLILLIVAILVLVVIVLIILAAVHKSKSPDEPALCPVYQNTSRNTIPGHGSTGEKWRATSCLIPARSSCPAGFDSAPTIMISLDGFRHSYLNLGLTSNLQRLMDCGTSADYMRPAFPSKTFPNHYAIVTGLYPESHGIIDNYMYDKTFKDIFTLSGDGIREGRWWNGQPIWNTVKKAGKRAHAFFWPGSEADIEGMRPDECVAFDASLPFEWRVDGVLDWLDLPAAERPHLINVYFNEPDSAGHEFGPDSPEVRSNLTRVDGIIGMLMDGITKRGLEHCINVIVISDHGMSPIDCGDMIDISEKISPLTHFVYTGTLGRVTGDYNWGPSGDIVEYPNPEPATSIVSKLECRNYNDTIDWYSRAYLKQHLPKRFHYALSPRIEDVIVMTEEERLVTTKASRDWDCRLGDHGFDNTIDNMKAIFIAYGPSIKQNHTVGAFENIEVYNFMTDLLGVLPARQNGTAGRLYDILVAPPPFPGPEPSITQYESCSVPGLTERQARREASPACTCDDFNDLTSLTIDEADLQLNLTEQSQDASLSQHLPTGVPNLHVTGVTCLMTQRDYVTGYDHEVRMPLWAAYSLEKQTIGSFNATDDIFCTRPDVRIITEEATSCDHYVDDANDVTWEYLYPPGYSKDRDVRIDAYIATNVVPMYNNFKNGIWRESHELIQAYVQKYDSVQVISGPVFDNNYDGLRDGKSQRTSLVGSGPVPLPTHFFHTLTRCITGEELYRCHGEVDSMTIVIPHNPDLGNCWDIAPEGLFKYLQDNVARVKDVEQLTALGFHSNISDDRARIMLRTHLAVDLWPRPSWLDATDCPDVDNPKCPSDVTRPPTLLISLDGFRSEYLERGLTPVLSRLAECGVKTDYMRSVYPSLTFPNHYTSVTGLYPESHGIVDNNMFDVKLNQSFSLSSSNKNNPEWWGGEPIWNTMTKQNKTAMTFFWPGSDVAIQGMTPTRYKDFDGNVPYSVRVDQVVRWLSGSEGFTPDFVVLYIEKVDKAGHEAGPVSKEVDEALAIVDGYMAQLMDQLTRAGLDTCVNVIVTADHGMADFSCERSVMLQDFMDLRGLYVYPGAAGRMGNTYYRSGSNYYAIKPEDRVSVDHAVSSLQCVSPNLNVFATPLMPRRFHYANNPRVEQVQLVMAETWQVDRYRPWCPILGQHGWDPSFDSMKALFLAHGPSLRSKLHVEPFETIELYNLLADLIGVTPAPNNGTRGSLNHLMRDTPPLPSDDVTLDYTSWEYPNESEYQSRVAQDDCQHTCDRATADSRLDLSESQRQDSESSHLPFGRLGLQPNTTATLLQQEDYVIAFGHDVMLPLYAAFELIDEKLSTEILEPNCSRADVRLAPHMQWNCSQYESILDNYVMGRLFQLDFSSSNDSGVDTDLLTNIVPMLEGFRKDVWWPSMEYVISVARSNHPVYVTAGPVFDYDVDGLADSAQQISERFPSELPIPSHYFLTLQYCPGSDVCSTLQQKVHAYVLPHGSNITNCMDPMSHLFNNRVRLRDVELLTGLQYFAESPTQETIQLRVRLPEDVISRPPDS